MLKLPHSISADALMASQAGREVETDDWKKSQDQRELLEFQSDIVAGRLERSGVRMFDGEVTMVGLISEGVTTRREYRNSNLIPIQQARNTHDMLLHVAYWMDVTPEAQQRMFVISNGWVPIHMYRISHKRFTRLISRLSADRYLREQGVTLQYYSIENTFGKAGRCYRDAFGRPCANMHAHILVKSTRKLGSRRWQALMDYIRERFPKGYVHDGAVESAAELVKYVFKPSEFRWLSDKELARLYNETKGLRFHIPLDEIKCFRREVDEAGCNLRVLVIAGKARWRLVQKRPADPKEETAEPRLNTIVGITAPQALFTQELEPVAIVRNFSDLSHALQMNGWLYDEMVKARKAAENQRRSRPSIKDTTTITVEHNISEWDLDPPPDMDLYPPEAFDFTGNQLESVWS